MTIQQKTIIKGIILWQGVAKSSLQSIPIPGFSEMDNEWNDNYLYGQIVIGKI